MGYYDSYNPDLLKLIPPDAKTVLEIGCGEGKLCEAYRRVNPSVEWRAVELNQDAAKIAKSKGIVVVEDDVECFDYLDNAWHYVSNPGDEDAGIDCLVFGDVLEHLREPWKILKELAEIVHPSGQVLACIPNVQHWTVIRDLLDGKWDYADSGLLDRTHLRFFTLKSIREMFEQAGLQVHEIIGRDLFNDGYNKWLNDEMRDGVYHDKQFLAYQYLVRAFKPAAIHLRAAGETTGIMVQPTDPHYSHIAHIPKLHIHAIEAEDCCARPRIREPFAMLKTIPGVKCTTGIVPDLPSDANKILIRQRNTFIEVEHLRKFIADGWLIVQECDDYPLAYENGATRDWIVFRGCHAISCSTQAIAEIVRQYNPNVIVFENQIAELPPWRDREECGEVAIFFGAQNREADWAPIMPAINRVLADNPQVHFRVVHDRAFFDALNCPKVFKPFCDYAEYRSFLRTCHIALLPLEDTPFNRCKSDIKFLECAAEGVACLMNKTVYVATHAKAPGSGLWYDCTEDFEECLRGLIEDAGLRASCANFAYAYVRDNRLLSQHFRKRSAWYQSLLDAKPSLDQQLLERVPELSGHLELA